MRSPRLSAVSIGLVIAVTAFGAQAALLDLTALNSEATDGVAVFRQYSGENGAGSGNIDAFLRIQSNGTEKGYNTDGNVEFDTKKGVHTHAIQLSSIPELTVDGVLCRELMLDINQNSSSLLSLDSVKIYMSDKGNLTGYPDNFSSPIYDLGSNWVKLDDSLSSGSGQGDMLMYIPSSLFGSDDTKYVYLYSAFGENNASNGGFEEWGYGKSGPIGTGAPEPATMALLVMGGLALLARRKHD